VYLAQAQKMTKKEQEYVKSYFNDLEKEYSRDVILRGLLFLPEYQNMVYKEIDTSRIKYEGRIGVVSKKRLIPKQIIVEQLNVKEKEKLILKIQDYIFNNFSEKDYWQKLHTKICNFIALEQFFYFLHTKEVDKGWDDLYVAFASYPLIEKQVRQIIKEHDFRLLEEHYDHPDFKGEVAIIVLELSDKQQLELCEFLVKRILNKK
jgi:hypothetical protein